MKGGSEGSCCGVIAIREGRGGSNQRVGEGEGVAGGRPRQDFGRTGNEKEYLN